MLCERVSVRLLSRECAQLTGDVMEREKEKEEEATGQVSHSGEDLQCACVCEVLRPRASHTHSSKTASEIPPGSGEVGVSHVLINGSLIPLS